TGINKLLKSDALQVIINKIYDGTFSEFLDDWKWIFSFSKKYRIIIIFYTVVGIFGSTMSLGASYVSKTLINIIVGKEVDKVWLLLGGMIGMTLFSLLLSSVSSRIFTRISIYVNNDIQAEIFDNIIDARWKELSSYQSGDILNRFNNDVGTIAANAINWIPNLIINIYTFGITFVVLYHTDHAMAWIAFLSAPFLLAMSRYIMRKMKEYRKRVLELNSKMMSFEVETFYNFDTIKSFGIFGHYSKKLREWQKLFKDFNLDYNKFEIKSKILLTLVSTFVSLIAFGYCLYRLWTGQIQYGDMTFFLQQRSSLSTRFNTLVGTIPGMLNSAVSAHRIRELIDLPRETHDSESFSALQEIAQNGISVKLSGVTFSYMDGDKKIYENAEFEANPGEIVAVLSPSGGGKTTLMRLLLGMLEPDNGSVTLTGSDKKSIPINADLRQFFSYVPQGNTMLAGTVADNMRMIREDISDAEIKEALRTACALDFVEELKDGINSKVGERGRGISEGQAQRLSIARAIVRNSPILLLDEATSALDIKTEEQVLKSIIKQHPNKVIIISTHRPSALKLCQRIYRITGGGIKETSIKEAESLMWRYSDMPEEKKSDRHDIKTPDMPLSPKDETDILPDNKNEGWWN
ncbi:MAG: ABC transporter ATP-binding protein, partial [Clostridia bacterium]|nr:ABC transporter ATP-binding protein [Clostridia bacterium]